jgi:site-specific DNA-methyltransferase (adenine-specific)
VIIINTIKLVHGNCLDKLKQIKDKSINLVLIDPPYNISKAEWDTWKTIDDYIEFMGQVFLECERVLKDNGSFYFFHNDFEQMAELQHWIKKNTEFIFNSFITWDKGDFRALSWKNPSEKSNLRSWFNTCEYCLFYTFQDETGLKMIDNKYVVPQNPFRTEIIKARQSINLSTIDVAEIGKFYGKVNHGGSVSNWEKGSNIPTKEQYEKLQTFLPLHKPYEELREKYEELRYTHNLDKNHNNIWKSTDKRNTGKLHPTQKPIDILQRIIQTSSHEGDMVLDCFMGSGSTAEACINTNRNFIGIELDSTYFETCKNRTNTYINNNNLQDIHIEIA